MKKSIKLLSITVLATSILAGCQSLADTSEQSNQNLSVEMLQHYNWQLVDAKDANGQKIAPLFTQPDQPLTLNFTKSDGTNILYLGNTCNNFSTNYTIENSKVNLGHFAATMMACPTEQANFDNAAVKAVKGDYKLIQTYSGNSEPVLTVTHDGQVAHFKAIPKS